MNIQYIMPLTVKKVKEELGLDIMELEDHISKKDIKVMNDLKVFLDNIITKPLVVEDNINVPKNNDESLYEFDGYVVYIPDDAISCIKNRSLLTIYNILNAIVVFYNKETDAEILDPVILDNYVMLKSKLTYPKQDIKEYY